MATKKIERNGFTFEIERGVDEYAQLNYLKQDYEDDSSLTPEERATYMAQDRARLEAFERGKWSMIYIAVKARVKTSANWVQDTMVGRAYLHGIESDSGEVYLVSVEHELIKDALADAEKTYLALVEVFRNAKK